MIRGCDDIQLDNAIRAPFIRRESASRASRGGAVNSEPLRRVGREKPREGYPNSTDTDKLTVCVEIGKQNEIHREAEKCTRFSLASYKMGIDASEQTSLFASLQSCRKSAFIVSWIHFVTRK